MTPMTIAVPTATKTGMWTAMAMALVSAVPLVFVLTPTPFQVKSPITPMSAIAFQIATPMRYPPGTMIPIPMATTTIPEWFAFLQVVIGANHPIMDLKFLAAPTLLLAIITQVPLMMMALVPYLLLGTSIKMRMATTSTRKALAHLREPFGTHPLTLG